MINQHTTPRKYRKIIFNLINAFNVAFDLCLVKKYLSFYQEVLLSRLSLIEFKKYTKTMTSDCLYLYVALC